MLISLLLACSDPPPPPPPEVTQPIAGTLDTGGAAPVAVDNSYGGGASAAKDGNRAPRIRDIFLEPDPLRSVDKLTVTVKARDPDDDRVKLDFKWFVNDNQVLGQEKKTLPAKHFKKGDKVYVEVEASDGRKETFDKSPVVEVINSPPEIQPPKYGVDKIDGMQVKATDPDNDRLTFRLEEAPPGLTINSTGRLSFKSSMEQSEGGMFPTRIIAEDPDGEYSAWEMKLTLNPSKQPGSEPAEDK